MTLTVEKGVRSEPLRGLLVEGSRISAKKLQRGDTFRGSSWFTNCL
jgi:hypothetical protein